MRPRLRSISVTDRFAVRQSRSASDGVAEPAWTPPPNSLAIIKWKHTFLFSEDGSSETEELRIRLVRNRNATLRFDPPFERLPPDPNVALVNAPPLETYRSFSCPQFQDEGLDAGVLTVEGPGFGPIEVAPAQDSEGVSYRAALPEGAIAGGTYRVSATGGADVGAFETIVEMPPPIDLTTNVPPGTVIPRNGPVLAEWTGAQSGSVVRMKLIVRVGSPYPRAWHMTTVHATDAKLSWGFSETFAPPPGRAEVSVFLEPETFSTFQAEGLTLGGQHVWEYEYRFTDLRVRVQ